MEKHSMDKGVVLTSRLGAGRAIGSFLTREWFPLLIVLGAGLRIGFYLANRSLWVDEVRIALNILHKGPRELLGPLEFDQIAPPGFLLLVKGASKLFGGSEFALRLVPLLAGLASLPLFFSLARRQLRPNAAPLACLLFAITEPLIYYSSEVKQYSSDVTVELLLWALTNWVARKPSAGRVGILGVAGSAALFVSHASVFVLGGIGLAFLLEIWPPRRNQAVGALALGGCWLGSLAVLYALSLHRFVRPPTLVRFFTESLPGFPPSRPLGAARWLLTDTFGLFRDPGGLSRGGLPLLCTVIGGVVVFRQNRRWFFTTVTPLALGLLAACLHFYPFAGRVALFITPTLYFLIPEGVEEVRLRTQNSGPLIPATLGALLLLQPAADLPRKLARPKHQEQAAPVLKFLSRSRQAGDVVYLYYGAQYATRYYLETRDLSLADVPTAQLLAAAPPPLPGSGWLASALVSVPPSFLVGLESREDRSLYAGQLDALAGKPRVWIIFSHVWTVGGDERKLFLQHLDRIGTRLATFKKPGASAFLYDLRPPRRTDGRLLLEEQDFADRPLSPGTPGWLTQATMVPSGCPRKRAEKFSPLLQLACSVNSGVKP